jgi:Cupin domain
MARPRRKALDRPDETRQINKGKVDVVEFGVGTVMRTTLEPGWRWSECVKPVAGGDSCQVDHFGYCLSGRLHIQMNNGEELDIGPGDVVRISPGHDGWVIGDEPYVAVDFAGGAEQAKPGS